MSWGDVIDPSESVKGFFPTDTKSDGCGHCGDPEPHQKAPDWSKLTANRVVKHTFIGCNEKTRTFALVESFCEWDGVACQWVEGCRTYPLPLAGNTGNVCLHKAGDTLPDVNLGEGIAVQDDCGICQIVFGGDKIPDNIVSSILEIDGDFCPMNMSEVQIGGDQPKNGGPIKIWGSNGILKIPSADGWMEG